MFLTDTYICPILGPLVALFWISGDVSSGFQSQSGFCLICFCEGECNVHSLRSTSRATPADFLTASITADHFPTQVGLELNGQSPTQKTSAIPLYQRHGCRKKDLLIFYYERMCKLGITVLGNEWENITALCYYC